MHGSGVGLTVSATMDGLDGFDGEAAILDDVEVEVCRSGHVQQMVRHPRLLLLAHCGGGQGAHTTICMSRPTSAHR